MILLKVICETKEKKELKREEFHKALVGSPAYKNSEIAVCDEDETSFLLIIGNNNSDNLYLKTNANRLSRIKKEK